MIIHPISIIFHCFAVILICSFFRKANNENGIPKEIYRGPNDHISVKCWIAQLTTPTPHAKKNDAIITDRT